MELELSTSPRSTWVWFPDTHTLGLAEDELTAAGCSVRRVVGIPGVERVLDIDIGVEALEGMLALDAAGYTFRWHESQHVMNRVDRFGIAIADS